MRTITLIIIHCSATPEGKSLSAEACRQDHIRHRGFRDIGYHFYITRDGEIHLGRPLEKVGAHCRNHNTHSIGICYERGLDANGQAKDTRTLAQRGALLASFIIISSHLLYSTFLYFFNPPISQCTTLTIKVDRYLHYWQSTQNIIPRNDADDSKSSISIIFFTKQRKKYQIYTRQLSFSFSHYSTTGLALSIRQYLLSTSMYYQHKASVKYLFH